MTAELGARKNPNLDGNTLLLEIEENELVYFSRHEILRFTIED